MNTLALGLSALSVYCFVLAFTTAGWLIIPAVVLFALVNIVWGAQLIRLLNILIR